MGKNWTVVEVEIVSDVYLKNYHKAKFKIDSNGKFNPTKGATQSMNGFYKTAEKALLEKGFSRTAISIQKKEPDFFEWIKLYKHAVEKSGGESVVGRRWTFVPMAKFEAGEENCAKIMENFFSAFGNSPKTEPELLEGSMGIVNLAKTKPTEKNNDLTNDIRTTLANINNSIEKENTVAKASVLDDLLKKSQIYAQLKSGGMSDEKAMELSKLNE